MKLITNILLVLIVLSCENPKEKNPLVTSETKEHITNNADEKTSNKQSDVVEIGEIEILLPMNYRDQEDGNQASVLTKNWLALVQKNGKFHLEKAKYTAERGYDGCTGDSTINIETKNKAILLLENSGLKEGEVNSVKLTKTMIWPKEKLSFTFENQQYTLRAKGKVLSSEQVETERGLELFQRVEQYELFLSSDSKNETLVIEQESFNDTFIELLFVGDLDRDGKPDILLRANKDYEEERVILYLSSKAKGTQLLKKASEIAVQFDC